MLWPTASHVRYIISVALFSIHAWYSYELVAAFSLYYQTQYNISIRHRSKPHFQLIYTLHKEIKQNTIQLHRIANCRAGIAICAQYHFTLYIGFEPDSCNNLDLIPKRVHTVIRCLISWVVIERDSNALSTTLKYGGGKIMKICEWKRWKKTGQEPLD